MKWLPRDSQRSGRLMVICLLILTANLTGVLTLAAPVSARPETQTAGELSVSGTVINGTEAGTVLEATPVLLRFFDEFNWTAVYTSSIAADGSFRFEAGDRDDLDTRVGETFVVQVTYQGVDYFSETAPLSSEPEENAGVEVRIYETTDDPTEIQVDQAHFFLVPGETGVRIAELYLVGNTGNRTYIGALDAGDVEPANQRTTLHFALPADVNNLSFDGAGLGERYTGSPQAFADTRPVPPGTATVEIGFNYDAPLENERRVTRALNVPVQSILLILSSERLSLVGEGLTFNGMLETQMGVAASYLAGPLDPGVALDFAIVNQPPDLTGPVETAPGDETTGIRDTQREMFLGVGALAAAALIGFALWRPSEIPPIPPEARETVAKIAQLDAAYESGDVDDVTYDETRAVLREALLATLKQAQEKHSEHGQPTS